MSKKSEWEVENPSPNNQNILYIVIIILLIIIAVWAFFIGMKLWNTPVPVTPSSSQNAAGEIASDITITIYDDTRCTNCQTDVIVDQLKQVPVLTNAAYITKDFSEDGVSDFLTENGITKLPAAIFSTNAVWSELAQYLAPLEGWEFSLALGASYDPFVKRSDNWFLIAEDSVLKRLQETAYYTGAENAKITWIEYTDVNCHYCKKMETDGTSKEVLALFPEDLNKTSSNFIGVGWAATQKAAEILECSWKEGGAEVYNTMISAILTSGENDEDTMLALAEENGLNKTTIKTCLDNGDMKEIVAEKFNTGSQEFGITGTPGNVIINNETGEYEVVSGAYPSEKFIETVNLLLGKS